MATFIQGVTDEFGPVVPYQPNWDFLDKVYGTKQAEYERGFSALKNVYNSMLNSPLTNGENEQFRKDMFRKIQNSLRNTSSMDLSDPRIIQKAVKIMDPVSQDEELIYDMYVTKFHQQQRQIMDQYKNSTDPKMRAMYSKYAEQDINFSEQDLRQAKRGDNSIRNVQPREFTPFEDVNEYLRKAAKEEGIDIVFEGALGNGYIIKKTNGENAILPFTQWAITTMGNRFDRQFEVMGRVESESEIRRTVEELGISRQDAIQIVAKKFTPTVKQQTEKEFQESDINITKLDDQIKFYENTYRNGFPPDKPEVKEKYLELLRAKEVNKDINLNTSQTITSLNEQGDEYTAANIYNLLGYYAKQQSSVDWATSTAMATEGQEIRADQVWLTKANISSRERQAQLDRAMRYQMHQESIGFNEWKHNEEMSLKIQIAQGKGELPSEQHLSTFLPSGENDVLFGIDILNAATSSSRTKLYNNVFSASEGLVNLAVLDDKSRDSYIAVMNKVNAYANGGKDNLTSEDYAVLERYGKLVGRPGKPAFKSAQQASAYIDDISYKTYSTAVNNLDHYATTGTSQNAYKYDKSFTETIGAVRTMYDQRKSIYKSYKEVNNMILNADGSLKPQYKGAVRVGTFADGTPIYDLSNMDPASKKHLSSVVSSEFVNRSNPVGNTYNFTGVNGGEMFNLINGANNAINSDGSPISLDKIKQLNLAEMSALFGNSLQVSYDPGNKKAFVELNVGVTSPVAKSLGVKQGGVIKIEVPYSSIESGGASMERFGKYIPMNTVNSDPYGLFEMFSSNKYSSVRAPENMQKMGFDYNIIGSFNRNGNYELSIRMEMLEPGTKKVIVQNKVLPVDPEDPESFVKVNNFINTIYTNYKKMQGVYTDATNNDGSIFYIN